MIAQCVFFATFAAFNAVGTSLAPRSGLHLLTGAVSADSDANTAGGELVFLQLCAKAHLQNSVDALSVTPLVAISPLELRGCAELQRDHENEK